MNYEKVGKFIKELRKEKGWSQEQLAEKIYTDRTKINKIENGKRYINTEEIIMLMKLFNISFEEINAGERKNTANMQNINEMLKKYLNNQNSKIKKLKVLSIAFMLITFLCITLFAVTYLFQNYGSIRFYSFYGESKNYEINDGILILSKDKIYFKVGSIYPEIKEISIYSIYKDKSRLIYSGSPLMIIKDNFGYNSFINYNDIINNKQKIFILANNEKIELKFKEEFINNKFFYKERQNLGKNKNGKLNIPKKIKEKFKCNENDCNLEINDEVLIYNNNIFSVKNKNEFYLYDIENNILEYQNIKNLNMNFTIIIIDNKVDCISGNCDHSNKVYKKFEDTYILKYLK